MSNSIERRKRKAEYMKTLRKQNPLLAEANNLQSKARYRALRRLAQYYEEEFREILDEERAEVGLPPVGLVGRGCSSGSLQLADYVAANNKSRSNAS